MVLSHLPIEVERALRDIPHHHRPASPQPRHVAPQFRHAEPRHAEPRHAEPRHGERRHTPRFQAAAPLHGTPRPAFPNESPAAHAGLPFHSPQGHAAPRLHGAPTNATSESPSFFSTALLLALVPPIGILAVWSLPSYPREGKIAASIGSVVWMLVLGLAFVALA